MARNRKSYTGGQYRGGRRPGRKNLTKTDAGVINQHGVEFTNEQKKALESAVNTANRKRARMLKAEAQLPRLSGGKPTGDTVGTLQLMGRESDFILQPKTKSLQRFKSMDEYNRYMTNLQRVNSRDYVTERVRLYKRNHMQAIRNVYGDQAKDIEMKIRMMKPADYMKMVQQNEDTMEIHYVYSAEESHAKMEQMRAVLGMKSKDYMDDEY